MTNLSFLVFTRSITIQDNVMTIEAIKSTTGYRPVNKKKMSAAAKGAIGTAAVVTASNAAFWLAKPKEMNMIIKEYGGKSLYAKNFAVGLATLSVLGAGINSLLYVLSQKAPEKTPPRAVN